MEHSIQGLLVCFGFGIYLIFNAFKKLRRSRLVEDTPLSKIATAPQGWIELEGFAWPRNNVVRKNSEDFEVVHQVFELQQQLTTKPGTQNKKEWVTVFQTRLDSPFYLLDPTGLVLIDPSTGEMELGEAKVRGWKALAESERTLIKDQIVGSAVEKFPPTGRFFGLFDAQFRIKETEIRVGSPLYATADYESSPEGPSAVTDPGLSQFFARVMSREARTLKDLSSLLDKNHDAVVSTAEATQGYTLCAKMARSNALVQAADEEPFQLYGVLRSIENRKLYLAAFHRKHLLQKLKSWVFPSFLGGAAMTAFSFVMAVQLLAPSQKPAASQMVPTEKVQIQTRAIAEEKPFDPKNLSTLHYDCIKGNHGSCQNLLEQREVLHLSPEYVRIYQKADCKAANLANCDEATFEGR